jgi:sigma-B regulation protein RsbU (phosphoserine phosphatase)
MFDVAGGLQEARAIMVPLQRTFRSSTPQLFNGPSVNETECLLELWLELNKAVMTAASGVHSCPAFLGCYNEDVQTLSYVNAGHTPALCRSGDQISALGATALPLGLFSHSIPECSVLALGPGNAILLVSKGVVEARRRGEEFGIERVQQYFAETVVQSAHETCVGILAHVRQFMGTAPTHNDVTALSLIRSLEAE